LIQQLTTAWKAGGLNPDGGKKRFSLLHTLPEQSCCPPSLHNSRYQGSFLGVKSGHGIDYSPPSSTRIRAEYSHISTPSQSLPGVLQGGLYLYVQNYLCIPVPSRYTDIFLFFVGISGGVQYPV